jgi:hypothetical protein
MQFPGYRFGDDGTVQSRWVAGHPNMSNQWRTIIGHRALNGYQGVRLRVKPLVYTTEKVHRLILEAFCGPCPAGMEARHLNGNRRDNRLSNLCWGTPVENANDKRSHGTVANTKLTEPDIAEIIRLASEDIAYSKIAVQFGVHESTIGFIVRGKDWAHLNLPRRSCLTLQQKAKRAAKLTEKEVLEIRSLSTAGSTNASLAAQYSVTNQNISAIVLRQSWKHI